MRQFSSVTAAENENIKRFEDSLKDEAKTLAIGQTVSFYDYWDKEVTANIFSELYYASGTFTITSYGQFTLKRSNRCVFITGTVDHLWWDKYDWHAGLRAYIPGFGWINDADALALENAGRAKKFFMTSEWFQNGEGIYTIHKYWFDSLDMTWESPRGGSSGARVLVVRRKGQKAIRPK